MYLRCVPKAEKSAEFSMLASIVDMEQAKGTIWKFHRNNSTKVSDI